MSAGPALRAQIAKWLVRGLAAFVVLFLAAFWQLFFSARPPLTTDPATLAGDGSTLDYCDLPILDGFDSLGEFAQALSHSKASSGCSTLRSWRVVPAWCQEPARRCPSEATGRAGAGLHATTAGGY